MSYRIMDNEKEIRRYRLFEGVSINKNSTYCELAITNKRLIFICQEDRLIKKQSR